MIIHNQICQKERIEKERSEAILRFCSLPVNTEHMTFENFDTHGYPSLTEGYKLAYELANSVGDVRWLTMLGGKDLGKTHLAIAICRTWLYRKKAAKYAFTSLLLKDLRDGFDMNGEESYRRRFDALCNVPLLVLDDIGVERASDWAQEQIQTIIHYRGVNGLHLVVTSNKPLTHMAIDPEGRIASRLQRESWCRVVTLDGLEHRLWK